MGGNDSDFSCKVVGAKDMMLWMVSLLTVGNAVRNDVVGFTWGILIFYLNHRLDI